LPSRARDMIDPGVTAPVDSTEAGKASLRIGKYRTR
jgi:hypothetical protein